MILFPVDTGRKLNVLCTFNLRPVSAGLEEQLGLWGEGRSTKRNMERGGVITKIISLTQIYFVFIPHAI